MKIICEKKGMILKDKNSKTAYCATEEMNKYIYKINESSDINNGINEAIKLLDEIL